MGEREQVTRPAPGIRLFQGVLIEERQAMFRTLIAVCLALSFLAFQVAAEPTEKAKEQKAAAD